MWTGNLVFIKNLHLLLVFFVGFSHTVCARDLTAYLADELSLNSASDSAIEVYYGTEVSDRIFQGGFRHYRGTLSRYIGSDRDEWEDYFWSVECGDKADRLSLTTAARYFDVAAFAGSGDDEIALFKDWWFSSQHFLVYGGYDADLIHTAALDGLTLVFGGPSTDTLRLGKEYDSNTYTFVDHSISDIKSIEATRLVSQCEYQIFKIQTDTSTFYVHGVEQIALKDDSFLSSSGLRTEFSGLGPSGQSFLFGATLSDLYEYVNAQDADTDNDGIVDSEDNCPAQDNPAQVDFDGDGEGDLCDSDDDNDGVNDGIDAFPYDSSETVDTDNDGIGNNADTDDDGDGISDAEESALGTNPLSADSDGDDVTDDQDAFPLDASEYLDTDGDGVGDNGDAFPDDATESIDSDGDGVGDNTDAFPSDLTETVDTDNDGIGNNADTDDDADGVADDEDAFPLDSNESVDTDGDAIGNNTDTDDDGDGFSDEEELAAGTDPLNSESLPSNNEGGSGGLPIWMLYIATEPKAA